MKKKFSFAMVLLLIFNLLVPPGLLSSVSAAEVTPNEVLNFDFEDDSTTGWSSLGWDNLAPADIEIVTDDVTGEKSLGYLNRPTETESRLLYDLGQELTQGEIYTISFDVKLKEGTTNVVLGSKYSYPSTDPEYNEYPWLINPTAVNADDWTTLTLENFGYEHEATELLVWLQTQNADNAFTTNDYYLDNFKVMHVGTMEEPVEDPVEEPVEGIPAGEEVAADTDFEDGTAQGWVQRQDNVVLDVTADAARDSKFGLSVSNRLGSSDAALIDLFDEMYPGHEYNFSLWVKLAPGQEDTPLQLSAAQTVNGETTYYPPVIEPVTVTSDEWVLLEGTYAVPQDIEALSFYVEEEYDEAQTTGVSYYIDDFKAEVYVPDYAVEDLTPLKDIYADHFYIGNAVGTNHFAGRDLEIMTKHHNLITAENVMKPEAYYDDQGNFTHSSQDAFLQNAVDKNLLVHGHVLMWHSQSEDSLYQNEDGSYKTPDEALANMKTHISKVMTSADAIAGDSLISWDVVNEALDGSFSNPEDWKSNLRQSSGWLQSIGDDYLYEAYKYAREVADSLGRHDMVLYYNDYNDHLQPKARTMYHMVKDINERYAEENPDDDRKLISGVGMQSHYTTSVNIENVRTSLERFIELGVDVGVTELDVGASNTTTLTEEEEKEQAYFYAQLFDLYKEHSDHMSRVTLWGLSDRHSWRSEDNPLLFDGNLQAKEAYYALQDTATYIEENAPIEVEARSGDAAFGTATIDGEIEELWSNAPVLPIDRFQSAHNGATGEARVLWDAENLYVLVEVTDGELDKTSANAYEHDSVEVFLDEQNTKAASYGDGHGQYRVNFDNEQSFNPGDISEGFESEAVVDGTNYFVEMKIPFKTTSLVDVDTIGFDVQINDAVDGARNSVAIWNDYTGMGWSDPSVYGNLTLVEPSEEQLQIEELKAKIEELKQQIEDLKESNQEQIGELQEQVTNLETLLEELTTQIEEQGATLEDLVTQIGDLTSKIEELLSKIEDLEEQLGEEPGETPGEENPGEEPVEETPGETPGGETPGETPEEDGSDKGSNDGADEGTEDESDDSDENELPDTATNTYNWLAVGTFMLIIGAGYLLYVRRKRA
ncbi:endo-1,4-beta-xylanase [Aquibacillus koreensis]|uniref:Beta-xylanase n=1 Tax=Aquibacillus koreensis TaxID=279446 RepID=A0A9X3WNU1_9BACI|nr:endo-1,4-beta-xylanase [Aquibacillus koreensis]MCT2537036.1 endo-1,4-beta-xylanase [Aquibacillus koreensis]MDC3422310.1 endo-1,4-beta-xylanase [Aquibacillus koreensis]